MIFTRKLCQFDFRTNSESVKEIRDQYVTQFDPEAYHSTFYSILDEEVKFFLRNFNEAFDKDPLLTNRDSTRRRLLDFGCGPVPIYAATAASYTNSITMAEIVPASRVAVARWMNSDNGSLEWDTFFTYISSLQVETQKEDIADMLRNSFQLVLPCDGCLTNPLSPVCQTYDVVMSTLCLEFATTSIEDYQRMVVNMTNLLKPGGILLMAGALGNTSYSVGSCKYPSVNLTKEDVVKAVTSQGTIRVSSLKTLKRRTTKLEKPADHNGIFFLLAQNITLE